MEKQVSKNIFNKLKNKNPKRKKLNIDNCEKCGSWLTKDDGSFKCTNCDNFGFY